MKIVRGKVAIALVGVILLIPVMGLSVVALTKAAMNRCTATPTSEPDSVVTVEFKLDSFDWICHKRWVDTGVLEEKHISFFP